MDEGSSPGYMLKYVEDGRCGYCVAMVGTCVCVCVQHRGSRVVVWSSLETLHGQQ